jgi:hypothetical protein
MAMVDKNSVAAGVYAATKNQILAETQRAKAQARMWNWGGASLGALAIGGGIWLGCLGYAKTQEPDVKAAQAYMAALQTPLKVEVTTHGEVTAHGTVNLADGGRVTASGMVGVSPDSTVRAVMSDMPRPTAAQIQADARPDSGAPVVTDFVIFKTAPYGKGEVQSGWQFADSKAKAPAFQWCLFVADEPDGARRSITLGKDGQRVGLPTPAPVSGVDLQAAFASCVWTNSKAATAPAPVNRQDSPPPPRVITARKG